MAKTDCKMILYIVLIGTLAFGGCAKTNEIEEEQLVAWEEERIPEGDIEGTAGDTIESSAAISGLESMIVPIKDPTAGKEEVKEAESMLNPEKETGGMAYIQTESGKGTDNMLSGSTESGSEISGSEDSVTRMESGINDSEITEADWSEYFDGFNGAAVLWNPSDGRCAIYNLAMAQTRRSPCSTFKIISALAALENGILDPEDSVRTWSGEKFWNGEWNRDIDFEDAFRASCVWYFRELIDETGSAAIQETLDVLAYGNCDISDWEGRQNTNNSNPALTGFWLESSLKISPKEQAEVMERIFGEDTIYSEKTRNALKKAMLVPASETGDSFAVYGKTGTGMSQGVVVDAWFTGFAEREEGKLYFCVYLGETETKEVTGAAAREIAVRILTGTQ